MDLVAENDPNQHMVEIGTILVMRRTPNLTKKGPYWTDSGLRGAHGASIH